MPPWASWWRGGDTIAEFAKAAVEFCAEARSVPIAPTGSRRVAYYHLDAETGAVRAGRARRHHLRGPLIKEITAFVTPEIFPRFGLPAELAS